MALPLSYSVRNLVVRWKVTALATLGIAMVVAVFVALVAMLTGFREALRATGIEENAIVVQRGSQSELTSGILREHANRIMVNAHVARGADGQPQASPEVVVVAALPRRVRGESPQAGGEPVNVLVRGVTPKAFEVRAGIRIVEGRRFEPGLAELIVGRRIQERIAGLELGGKLRMQGREWTVVGVFASDGSGFESEVWGDAVVVGQTFERTNGYESVVVRLRAKTELKDFADELAKIPELAVEVTQERRYYEQQAGPTGRALLGLALFVALVMGSGAAFAAMNTMYALVALRARELGTLQALGFTRGTVIAAVLVESVCLALCGGVLGSLLALVAHGATASTAGDNFAELAFAFQVTPAAMAWGLAFAALMGLAGGVLPAWKASRRPIPEALRAP